MLSKGVLGIAKRADSLGTYEKEKWVLLEKGKLIVTNGYYMIEVEPKGLKDDEFPQMKGVEVEAAPERVILKAEVLSRAASLLPKKPFIPVLAYARLGMVEGKASLIVHDLENPILIGCEWGGGSIPEGVGAGMLDKYLEPPSIVPEGEWAGFNLLQMQDLLGWLPKPQMLYQRIGLTFKPHQDSAVWFFEWEDEDMKGRALLMGLKA